jgi:hypothetical protein
VHNPPNIDHEQYDKLVALLVEEEDNENDNDFEPEIKEDSTSGESDNALLGLGFVRRRDRKSLIDEDDLRNAITRFHGSGGNGCS